MDIEEKLLSVEKAGDQDLKAADSVHDVEALRIKFLGKKGAFAELMVLLKEVPIDLKPSIGQKINLLKQQFSSDLDQKMKQLEGQSLSHRLEEEYLDISLPGNMPPLGRRHVLMQVLEECIDIMVSMGFVVQTGPDIESDYYNFEALNFASDHPARDMQDTFYLDAQTLLRTHTSNTQVRVMQNSATPIRIAAPGRCFRNEDVTARSHVVFHQIEGLYIDEGVNFMDLTSCLDEFFHTFFARPIQIRYRPSYFPFVEPGMEVDISCIVCNSTGCNVCKHSGWLEVMGAGLVHPEVLKSGGIDPEKYSGFAFGFGIERLAMLRHSIEDIRLFFMNRIAFLQQF